MFQEAVFSVVRDSVSITMFQSCSNFHLQLREYFAGTAVSMKVLDYACSVIQAVRMWFKGLREGGQRPHVPDECLQVQ